MSPELHGELLADVAAGLARMVGAEDADVVHRWLYSAMRDLAAAMDRPGDMATVTDWMGLAVVLSTAVRDDVPFAEAVRLFLDRREPPANPWLVDPVAVQRACDGERVRLTGLERREAVAQLSREGLTVAAIAGRLHMTTRSVERHRAALRKVGEAA